MTEINWQEICMPVLVVITWGIILVKFIDIWAARQFYDLYKSSKNRMENLNRDIMQEIQSSKKACEEIRLQLELSLINIEAELEYLLETSRKISSIDDRTLEISNMMKSSSIHSQLLEALQKNRRSS